MQTITLEDVAANLEQVIDELNARGETVMVTRDNFAVAKIVPVSQEEAKPKRPLTDEEWLALLYRVSPVEPGSPSPTDESLRRENIY